MIKNKKIIIFIVISIIILLLLYLIKRNNYNYTKLLENKELDIVYDKVNNDKDKVPYINITNKFINDINQDINSIYEDYLIFSPDGFNYRYSISNNILSIIITAHIVKPESTHYDITYKSYNIDLQRMKLLTNKEILNKYNISEEKMKYYLYNKFLNYYKDLVAKNYFSEEQCDFKTFLENKNIDNILDDNNFYINNNHLELYKYFNIFTDYKEENYFNEEKFHFIIT